MTESYDAVLVGAGAAGAVAALTIARGGGRVALFRHVRGQEGTAPGGLLWGDPFGSSVQDPPLTLAEERTLVEQRFVFLTDSALSIDFRDPEWGRERPQAITIESGSLVDGLVARAQGAGVTIVDDRRVEELVQNPRGHVLGVHAGAEFVQAGTTILADGSAALLGDATGRGRQRNPASGRSGRAARITSLMLTRSLRMDSARIAARFGVADSEGVALDAILSSVAGDQLAAGFLVTHRDSLTAGVEVHPISPGFRRATPELAQTALDLFLTHPFVAPLVRGAELGPPGTSFRRSFTGDRSDLGGPGYLVTGDAAGFGSSAATFVPEYDHAIVSGRCAGTAALAGAFGADPEAVRPVKEYWRLLREESLWSRFESERWLIGRVKWNRRVHRQYAQLLDSTMDAMMTETGGPKRAARKEARAARRGAGVRWTDLFRDLLAGGPT